MADEAGIGEDSEVLEVRVAQADTAGLVVPQDRLVWPGGRYFSVLAQSASSSPTPLATAWTATLIEPAPDRCPAIRYGHPRLGLCWLFCRRHAVSYGGDYCSI